MSDYLEEINPHLVDIVEWAGTEKEEATEFILGSSGKMQAKEHWGSRLKFFKLLKRKTLATSEANKLVKCGESQNGWE